MSRFEWLIAVVLSLLFVVGLIPHCQADDAPATQPANEQEQLETWWKDLANPDPQMSRALLGFAGKPEQATAFFKTKLQPLTLSQDDLDKLITNLGSDDEAVWKPAFEKLQYLDPRLAKDMKTLMEDVTEPVARNRLIEIMCGREPDSLQGANLQFQSDKEGSGYFVIRTGNSTSSWSVETQLSRLNLWGQKKSWTQAMRAVVLLEHFGTPDAIMILKDMAGGNPEAAVTKTAQEALTTLGVAAN